MGREQDLYDTWKRSGRSTDLETLIKEFDGTINNAARRFASGNVPESSLKIKAKQLTAEAIRTYDPNSGAKLNSWVTTNLNKLYRFYTSHNIVAVSEDMFSLQNKFFKQKSELEDTLGRDPTLPELADSMGIPEKKVLNIEKNFSPHYQDSMINTNKYIGFGETLDQEELHYIYGQLDESEQRLFKMKTGWPGGKPRTLSYIESKTGRSKSTLSRELKTLSEKLKIMMRM